MDYEDEQALQFIIDNPMGAFLLTLCFIVGCLILEVYNVKN